LVFAQIEQRNVESVVREPLVLAHGQGGSRRFPDRGV
jgi:hypothetical protein